MREPKQQPLDFRGLAYCVFALLSALFFPFLLYLLTQLNYTPN